MSTNEFTEDRDDRNDRNVYRRDDRSDDRRDDRSDDRNDRRDDRSDDRREKRIVSAGFIVRSKDGKYLVGKTTKYPKDQCWTVFKGQQERGESLIATATRELKEEAGIDILKSVDLQLSQSTSPYFSFAMKDKDVILYLLNDEKGVLDKYATSGDKGPRFKCSSYWGSTRTPEISDYKWCTLNEMEKLVFPSQRGVVECMRKSGLER